VSGLEDIGIDQTKRFISVEAFYLGPRKILVTAFEGTEALSTLSRFRLEIMSLGRALMPSEVLGQSLTVALRAYGRTRNFTGIISRFEATHSAIRDYYLHVVEMVPPCWLATTNRRCRIFHEMKATDIAAEVLGEWQLAARLKPTGQVREYVAQYGESDFAFVSRLLEEEGLYYYIAHAEQDCPIVLGDGAADYLRGADAELDFYAGIERWTPGYRIGGSSFEHAGWDFKTVAVVQDSANGLTKIQPPVPTKRPVYEYPAYCGTSDQRTALARARMEELESAFVRVGGETTNVTLQPALKFKIENHAIGLPAVNATTDSYVMVSVEHHARDGAGVPFEGPTRYANAFVCIPAELNFRPPRTTPRPMIGGPQTAIVTDGPDEFGRAKVRFHWENEVSRWTRVAQSWAFNRMGTQFLPRIDSEVVVEFLNGDPDEPLIVGMVHNGKNKLLYDVPPNKTQSGIRGANWGEPGDPRTSNELRFEDKQGEEQIYLHAQKDSLREVANDDTQTVGAVQSITVTGNRSVTVTEGNYTQAVATGTAIRSSQKGSVILSETDYVHVLAATEITLKAATKITLQAGQSCIELKQDGTITINGVEVQIVGSRRIDLNPD
jgi:type VI secretion system secreted protein VgrG